MAVWQYVLRAAVIAEMYWQSVQEVAMCVREWDGQNVLHWCGCFCFPALVSISMYAACLLCCCGLMLLLP